MLGQIVAGIDSLLEWGQSRDVSTESELKANLDNIKRTIADSKCIQKEVRAQIKRISLDREKAARARNPK
jgi:hypothetical protein